MLALSRESRLTQKLNKFFSKMLNEGDIFVFPQGLIHFQFNPSFDKLAVAIATLSSQNPGGITINSQCRVWVKATNYGRCTCQGISGGQESYRLAPSSVLGGQSQLNYSNKDSWQH
jgi:hypothetical protein